MIALADVVAHICLRAGLSPADYDVSDLEGIEIQGYVITRSATARAALEPLRMVGLFDIVESGGKLKFVRRGGAAVAALTAEDLGARVVGRDDDKRQPAVVTRKLQDVELPRQIRLRYPSSDRDYEMGEQLSPVRMDTAGVNDVSVEVPVVLTDDRAAKVAEIMFREAWASRWTHQFALDLGWHRLEPGDVVLLPVNERVQRVRIVTIADEALVVRRVEAVRDNDGSYVSLAVSTSAPRPSPVAELLGATDIIMLDLPPLSEDDDNAGFYAALWRVGTGQTWRGARVHRSADSGVTYAQIAATATPSTVGVVDAVPAAGGDGYTWDDERTMVVTLESGTLSSQTDEAVLAGANAAAIGAPGRWQIVQFASAELIGENTYRLSRLLLGRRGTEHLIDTTQVGDRFVLVSFGVTRMPLQTSEIGAERLYRAVTEGASFGSAADEAFTGQGAALKPFSPVNVAGTRDGSGNLTIDWDRRDRLAQTLGDGVPLPLSEASEAYEVEVLDGPGGSVVRTITGLTSPAAEYNAADQTTDFGSPQATVTVRVYQISAAVGRGTPAEATI